MATSSGPWPWTYTASNSTSVWYTVNQPSTLTLTPIQPAPKGPLEWLHSQVDEVCRLARVP